MKLLLVLLSKGWVQCLLLHHGGRRRWDEVGARGFEAYQQARADDGH